MSSFYKFFNSCNMRSNYVNITTSISLHEFQMHWSSFIVSLNHIVTSIILNIALLKKIDEIIQYFHYYPLSLLSSCRINQGIHTHSIARDGNVELLAISNGLLALIISSWQFKQYIGETINWTRFSMNGIKTNR